MEEIKKTTIERDLQKGERLEKKRRIDWFEQGDGRRKVAGNRTRIAAGAQEAETNANEFWWERRCRDGGF